MTTFLLGVLAGMPLGIALLGAAVWTYVLRDLRDEPADPDPPRMGAMGDEQSDEWRQAERDECIRIAREAAYFEAPTYAEAGVADRIEAALKRSRP